MKKYVLNIDFVSCPSCVSVFEAKNDSCARKIATKLFLSIRNVESLRLVDSNGVTFFSLG